MEYLYLSIAIVAEVVGTSALNASDGFTRLYPIIISTTAYILSLFFLSIVLKTIPVSIAYAIWSGFGISLIVIINIIICKQFPDIPSIIGITMIVTGVIIINLFSKFTTH